MASYLRLDIMHSILNDRRHSSTSDDAVWSDILMTPNNYQKLAMRTCSIPYSDKGAMLNHAVFGLTSEAGEVSGILQKVYQGHDVDPMHIKKELGDCLWMIAEACTALGFDLEDVMTTNIDKLKKRYPDGFSADRSINREDGDI